MIADVSMDAEIDREKRMNSLGRLTRDTWIEDWVGARAVGMAG